MRKDKNNVLHAYFRLPETRFLGIENVLSRYDRIFCVDTNCKTDAKTGKSLAVTTALIARPWIVAHSAMEVTEVQQYQSVNRAPKGNPEIEGIWNCFREIYRSHRALLGDRIALITDTEYENIRQWQMRTLPFYEGMMLPEGIDLFYATSDAGSDEFMPNSLIKRCDSLNNEKIRELLG